VVIVPAGETAGSATLALWPAARLVGVGAAHGDGAPAAGDVEWQLLAHSAIPFDFTPHRVHRDDLCGALPFWQR